MTISKDKFRTDFDWLDYPSSILVVGETGGGKSGTGHYIMESRCHLKEKVPCSMVAPQRLREKCKNAGHPLPDWLEIHGRMIPENHCVLIDDAQLSLHSREWYQHIKYDKIMSMHRHRNSTIILITQIIQAVDSNAVQRCDVSIWKWPPLMSTIKTSPGMKKFIIDVDNKFEKLQEEKPDEDMRAYSWVISNKPRYEGWVGPTPLPSYWSEKLSKW